MWIFIIWFFFINIIVYKNIFYLFIYLFYLFIKVFIHSFVSSLIHSNIIICSFIHLFLYSLLFWQGTEAVYQLASSPNAVFDWVAKVYDNISSLSNAHTKNMSETDVTKYTIMFISNCTIHWVSPSKKHPNLKTAKKKKSQTYSFF